MYKQQQHAQCTVSHIDGHRCTVAKTFDSAHVEHPIDGGRDEAHARATGTTQSGVLASHVRMYDQCVDIIAIT
jgi:hypothetical protein